jgi:hypothetical protein
MDFFPVFKFSFLRTQKTLQTLQMIAFSFHPAVPTAGFHKKRVHWPTRWCLFLDFPIFHLEIPRVCPAFDLPNP